MWKTLLLRCSFIGVMELGKKKEFIYLWLKQDGPLNSALGIYGAPRTFCLYHL